MREPASYDGNIQMQGVGSTISASLGTHPQTAMDRAAGDVPGDSTWMAAIHRSATDRAPVGAGVVIDDHRVLTSGHVLDEAEMQAALSTAGRLLAVLLPAYVASTYSMAEWRAAFAADPSGTAGRTHGVCGAQVPWAFESR